VRFSRVGLTLFLLLFSVSNSSFASETNLKWLGEGKPPPRIFEISGDGSSGPYYLPEKPVFQNCLEICEADTLLRPERDYSADFEKGLIFFEEPLKVGSYATVNYLPFPFQVDDKYSHHEIRFAARLPEGKDPSGTPPPLPEPVESSPGTSINLGGTKTISVEAGSGREVSLSQSLDLSIYGNILPGVRATALLSDRNAPISPSGTTRRLQELDRVLFEIESERFRGSLGDFYLNYQEAPLSRYRKKLQGIKGELRLENLKLLGAGANSKGEYSNNYFFGREGFQGPYYLTTPEGLEKIRMLPGTERVYLDGVLRTRGSENDYIIDYDNGSLKFTPRVLIDEQSRIEVDFEYSKEDFARSFYSGRGKVELFADRLSLGSTFILEKDDRNNPTSGVFTSEERSIIASAGADRDSSYKSGAKYVGDGRGDYAQEVDSLGSLFYRYMGEEAGDYSVGFSRVKSGRGTYEYLGGGIYEYVYEGGDYLPIIQLPLPEKHSMFGIDLSYDSGSLFYTSGEVALSSEDLNSLSDLDEEREDLGFELKSGLNLPVSKTMGAIIDSLNITSRFRHLGSEFSPFGRVEVLENQRRWDLPEGERSEEERLNELGVQVTKNSLLRFNAEYGKLDRGDAFDSERKSLEGNLTSPIETILDFQLEDIASSEKAPPDSLPTERDWKRGQVLLSQRVSFLTPKIGYKGEKRTSKRQGHPTDGFKYDEYLTGLKLKPAKSLTLSGEYILRQDEIFLAQWLKESESKSYRLEVNLREYKNSLSSQISYTKRKKKYFRGNQSDNDEDLIFTKLNYYHPRRALRCDLFASVNQVESNPVVKSYLQVEPGAGDFRYENGEYIPDPYGDYVEITEPVGEGRPTMEIVTGLDLTVEPAKFGAGKDVLWNKFKVDLSLDCQNRFLDRKRWSPELLNPWYDSKSDSLQYRRISFRNDLYFYPGSPGQEARLRYQRNERVTSLGRGASQEESEIRYGLRFRQPLLGGYSVEIEAAYGTILEELSNLRSLDIDSRFLGAKLILRPQRGLQLTLEENLQLDGERVADVKSTLLRSAPNLQWDFSNQGRADVTLAWSHVKVAPEGSHLNYRMAQGNKPGDNFEISANIIYRLGKNLEATLNYNFRAFPTGESRHFGKLLTRAYF